MQIVIEIDESLLDGIKSDDFDFARRVVKSFQGTIASAIANGTPLPKGHGRLIDADNLLKDRHKAIPVIHVIEAQTILEADEEN